MKKNDSLRILDKRCRRLQKQKEQLLTGFAAETNHDFRVEVKKLRAFLRLLKCAHPQAECLHLPKSLQQLYRFVGDVRSIQIQRQWVLSVCKELACAVPAGYMEVLARKEKEAIKRAQEKAQEISLPLIHQQLQKELPLSWQKNGVETFVRQKQLQLATLLSAVLISDEVLHDLRKLLKDLLYIWPIIEEEVGNTMIPGLFSKEACLRLAEKLGNYQDCCVVISLFSTPLLAGLSPGDQCRLSLIKERCCQKKEKEKDAILITLQLLRNELTAKLKQTQGVQKVQVG
jgi:CHAD domain-containing protein